MSSTGKRSSGPWKTYRHGPPGDHRAPAAAGVALVAGSKNAATREPTSPSDSSDPSGFADSDLDVASVPIRRVNACH